MSHFQLITVIIVITEFMSSSVFCKRTNVQDSDEKDQEYLWKIFGTISRAKENNMLFNGRKHDRANNKIRHHYETFSNNADIIQFKNWLRQEGTGYKDVEPLRNAKDELAGLVEIELLNALAKKSSAVLDKPYVQKKGQNDFLVIKSEYSDPFVTVVPNDIYYNVEKKCVNWLDDCNQRGLRDRLLQKLQGPYK